MYNLFVPLDKTGRSEMGLLLFGCSWSPSFGIGVTSAVFHFDGKTHVRKDSLTIDARGGGVLDPCLGTGVPLRV